MGRSELRRARSLISQALVLCWLLLLRPGPAVLADPGAATPGATAEVAVASLFATVLPAAALPVAPITDFLLWRATIDPGVTVVFPPGYGQCCPGPLLAHVLAGELTLRVEGPLQIVRAPPTATPGPVGTARPGTDVTLHPGDSALWRFELPTTFTNPGGTPLQMMSGGLFGGYAPGPLAGYQIPDFVESTPAPPLPPGAVTVELVRVQLPPGSELAAAPVGALRLVIRESGAGVLARRADGGIGNIGRTPVVVVVLTLFPHTGSGTLMPAL
jgi:hypothetical protein